MQKLVLYRSSDSECLPVESYSHVEPVGASPAVLETGFTQGETEMSLLQGNFSGSIASPTAALVGDPQALTKHNMWQDGTRDDPRFNCLGCRIIVFCHIGLRRRGLPFA